MISDWDRKPVPIGFVAATRVFFPYYRGIIITGGLSRGDYLELLDWTARQVAPGKRGTTPPLTPPLFQRLSGKLPTATAWVELVQDFGKLFATVAGHPQTIRATRSRISGFPHRMRPRVRELFPSSE
jgi:hypothetical protein